MATCSDGSTYDMPVSTKKAKTKLSKLQYRNRNKVLGNMKLSQRIFDCEKCDHVQDRDLNAATNLEFAHVDKIRLA